jgi:hypothetical protein
VGALFAACSRSPLADIPLDLRIACTCSASCYHRFRTASLLTASHCQERRRQVQTTHNTIAQRKGDNSNGNDGIGGSSDGISNDSASSAGRDKGIGGGGKEEVLT